MTSEATFPRISFFYCVGLSLKCFFPGGRFLCGLRIGREGRSSIKGMTILEVPNCSVVCALPLQKSC